jgi:hypothetical protein
MAWPEWVEMSAAGLKTQRAGADRPRVTTKAQRRHKRVAKKISALIHAGESYGQGSIKNLSREGMFLRSRLMPDPGADVRVRFETISGEKIEVTGIVRWSTAGFPEKDVPRGFGMRIDAPTKEYIEFFKALAKN